MNILITVQKFSTLSGSEIFTRDLAINLSKKGNNVFIYSPIIGDLSYSLKKYNIEITDNLDNFKKVKIDIIHSQHNITAIMARSYFPNTPMVFMSHGFIPEIEQPPSVNLGISKYIVTSDEIENHYKNKYKIPKSNIIKIYNSVDLKRFKPTSIGNKIPKKVLVLSNHLDLNVEKVIKAACKKINIKYQHVGLPNNVKENIVEQINNSDIIITLGRGVLESLACNRNVIVYDIFGADGLVTINNFNKIRYNNFSGRKYRLKYTENDLIKEIKKYNNNNPKLIYKSIHQDHGLDNNINKLINLYGSVIKDGFKKSKISSGELLCEFQYLLNITKKYENNFSKLIEEDKHIKNLEKSLEVAHKELQSSRDLIIQMKKKKCFFELLTEKLKKIF